MSIHHIKLSLNVLPSIAKWIAYCLLLVPTFVYSEESVLAVMSGQGKIYQDFYSTLEIKLQDNIKIQKVNHTDINNETLNKHSLVISVGFKSAKIISKYESKPTVIYSLIPDTESLQTGIPCNNESCYKVYINQPISRYIQLFKILFPEKNQLAYATTQTDAKRSKKLKIASEKYNLTYKEIYINQDSNIARTLINNLDNNDALLALPNPLIYNANSAKSIILSAYHKSIPIIAYSKAFTKAGALASLYSSIDNIAEKTAIVAKKIINYGHRAQKEYYPDDFVIETNSAVARSLNINIRSKHLIKRKIK